MYINIFTFLICDRKWRFISKETAVPGWRRSWNIFKSVLYRVIWDACCHQYYANKTLITLKPRSQGNQRELYLKTLNRTIYTHSRSFNISNILILFWFYWSNQTIRQGFVSVCKGLFMITRLEILVFLNTLKIHTFLLSTWFNS